jgi:Ca-activated chloride channel family protein
MGQEPEPEREPEDQGQGEPSPEPEAGMGQEPEPERDAKGQAEEPQDRRGEEGPAKEEEDQPPSGGPGERRPEEAGMMPPETAPEPGSAEAVDRFDQLGEQPDLEEGDAGATGALGGLPMQGPGMGILEQRLQQVEGDPSLLIRNQFLIEEMRQRRATGGMPRETRPW